MLEYYEGNATFRPYVPYVLYGSALLAARLDDEEGLIGYFETMVAMRGEYLEADAEFYNDIYPQTLRYLGDYYFDQENCERAREYYEIYLHYYPEGEDAVEIRTNLDECS